MTTEPSQKPPKKPYAPPRLKVYGDIRQLTQNANRNATRDGGANNLRT